MSGKVRRRKKRDSEFSTVYNNPFQRKDMSSKAKGILIYLMTLPEDWTLYKGELVTHFKDGKDSINSGIKELEKFGYFVTIKYRESGRYVYEYIFNDEPYTQEEIDELIKEFEAETPPRMDSHQSGFSAAVKPQRINRSGKPAATKELLIKDLKIKDINIKDIKNPSPNPIDYLGLEVPDQLKLNIKRLGEGLGDHQIYEIQNFYLTNPIIQKDCSKEDIGFLSSHEFSDMVTDMLQEVPKPIHNMSGLLYTWSLGRIQQKRNNFFATLTEIQAGNREQAASLEDSNLEEYDGFYFKKQD